MNTLGFIFSRRQDDRERERDRQKEREMKKNKTENSMANTAYFQRLLIGRCGECCPTTPAAACFGERKKHSVL